jgi:O-antigen/teichoic acid export membrane protein
MYAFLKRLIQHPNFTKYSKNISWMLFGRIFTMGVSFLTTLYIARTLGPTNFGELDYALAIIGMFGIVAAWGIEGVLNRELIKHPEHHNELIGTAFLLRFLLGLVAGILVICIAWFLPIDSLSKMLLIVLSFTYTIGTFTLLQQVFFAYAESKYPSIIMALVTLMTNLSKVFILTLGKGVIYLAASMILESILYALLYYFLYQRVFHRTIFQWSFSLSVAKTLLKTGTAIAFLGVFAMIYSRIDQIMIKHMLDATAVGLYSAGVRLVDVWGFIPTIIGAALYPAVLNARKISEALYHKRQRQLFFLYAVPAVIIAIGLSITAKPLMALIFGREFIDGFHALQIYAWSLPPTFIGYFVISVLFTDDHRKMLVFTTAFPALVNILLNMLWIPKYGIVGAAWATTLSYALIPCIGFFFKDVRNKLVAIYRAPTF